MRSIFHTLASLWLTIPILVVIAVILVFATFFDGLDVTIGAVRKDWYRSWWFNGLLGLLAVNLIACTVKRKPYQIWMWGFLKTHSGILLIIIGSMVSSMFKIYGDMPIAKGDSMKYVQLEDQRELTLSWEGSEKTVSFPVDFNWYRDSEQEKVYEIPGSGSRVRIRKFFSNVRRQPAKMPDRVELMLHLGVEKTPAFEVPKNQVFPIPGSPLVVSFVERSEKDYREMKSTGPDGSLEFFIGDEPVRVDVAAAKETAQALPGGGYLRILKVYDSLVIDDEGNIVDIEGNHPAVKIRIEHPTLAGTYYVLQKSTDGMVYAEGEKKGKISPLGILYKPPMKVSHFSVIRTPKGWRYYTTSRSGASAFGEFEPGDMISAPFVKMPIKLQIEFLRFLSSTDISVKPIPPEQNRPLYPALDLVFEKGDHRTEGSILFTADPDPDRSFSRTFQVGDESVDVTFSAKKHQLGMSVELKDARRKNHPGTMDAAVFESDVIITVIETGEKHEATIGVNYPFTLRGYTFYQSGFDDRDPDHPRSIFQVLYDPGTNIIYTGALLTVSGILFMFYLKPMILRARGRSQRFGGKSLRKSERILFGLFSLLIPFAVIFVHITRDRDPVRTYQRGRIVAVSWIVVLSTLMCYLGFFIL